MESSNNNLDKNDSIIRDDELHVSLVEVPSSSLIPLSLSLSHNTAATTTFAPPPQQQQRSHVDANNNNDEHEHYHHQDNAGANANANVDAASLYLCNKCNLMLGRHRFPKKILRKIINRRISSNSSDEVEEQNVSINTNANNITTMTKTTTATTTDDDASSLVVLICHQCRKINGAIRMKQPKPKYTILTDSGKSKSGLTRRPNNWGYCNYLDQLLSMNCYTDIVQLNVFHSAKDISESMAAIYAIFHHSTLDHVGVDEKKRDKKGINGERDNRKGNKEQDNKLKDNEDKVLCLCIGDGCTPRTAVLLSFLTKGLWDCVSIDPALSNEWSGDHHHHGSNNINSKSENDTSDSEQTQTQKQKQKQKQVVRGLYGYKGTLKEFVLDSNRPPFTKRTCTASNNNDPHNNNNNNNNNKQDGDNNNNNDNENEDKNDYYQHLILLCVHSHARFIEESTVDNIRSLYTDPNPSSTSSSSSSRATLPYCNDINNTPNLSPNTNPPPSTSLLIPTTIVSLPCCPQYRHVRDIGIQPHIKYDDDCVFSACRSVEVWNL